MLISRNLHNKSSEVSIITRSPTASISFKGLVTKHSCKKIYCPYLRGFNDVEQMNNKFKIQNFDRLFFLILFFGLSAKKHLTELQKRLDTTERTMHLVMKQMEAVTKCLAKTLADDPAMSGDKSLAEITEGLVNLKESNV